MFVELIALSCTFAGGFWCGAKFKTFEAFKQSIKGFWKK